MWSFLKVVARDAKAVFSWLGSDSGKATVQGVETAGVLVAGAVGGPPAAALLTAGENLFNNWLAEILKSETIAVAAGQQNGSGTIKSAAVLSAMTPQLVAFLQQQGVVASDAATRAKTINDALVLALNTLGGVDTAGTVGAQQQAQPAKSM